MLTRGLGLLDSRFVIPAVTAGNFADARRSEVDIALGFLGSTPADGRAAPDGELVDLGRPVIQTRIHHVLLMSLRVELMLRPTRSLGVTEPDIVRALRGCNMIKTKSFDV